jgi:hypothetical protein
MLRDLIKAGLGINGDLLYLMAIRLVSLVAP